MINEHFKQHNTHNLNLSYWIMNGSRFHLNSSTHAFLLLLSYLRIQLCQFLFCFLALSTGAKLNFLIFAS